MNVAGLISSFATGTYTVTRTARGSITKGKTAAGTTSSVTITACIYPATGTDLKRLPENRRTSEAMNLITDTELYDGGQGSDYEADTVSVFSETWEVSDVDRWVDPESGDTGYKCLVSVVR